MACHPKTVESYRQTGMGRAFAQPATAGELEQLAGEASYFHEPSASTFTMIRRDGRLWQRRHQRGADGQPTNVMEKEVHYVMGSGNHARTYLHRTPQNRLVELPLGWYAEKGGYWAMNPGYDRADHDGFRRTISYDCYFCHNAYPEMGAKEKAAAARPFAEPVYPEKLPEGIACQRCHGEAARHVETAKRRGTTRQQIRAAITNPGRFSPTRQLELCYSCHLESTSFPLPNAIQRYGRGPFSYQPDEPLANFLYNFDHAPGRGHDDKFEIVNAGYRLRQSACFTKSQPQMVCTTCHDPHAAPRGEAAKRHYNQVCQNCHPATALAARMPQARAEHSSESDCVGCHMPRRRTEDVIHVAATDHRIQRRLPPGDLLAERAERHESGALAYRGPVVPLYPPRLPAGAEGELYLAVAQVKQKSNLATGIGQLQAALAKHKPAQAVWYLELAEAQEVAGDLQAAVASYRIATQKEPAWGFAWLRLGAALRKAGQAEVALSAIEKATQREPERAVAWFELGQTLAALQRPKEAMAALRRALEQDAELPEAHNNLGMLLLQQGESAAATAAFREAVRIKPEYADARGNLANLLAQQGDVAGAEENFRASLRLRPRDAATRYNFALLLGRGRRYAEAEEQLRESLSADGNFLAAGELLADLLAGKGDLAGAVAIYQRLVQQQPTAAHARLGLARALLEAGQEAAALPHLRELAGRPNTPEGQAAQSLLQRLQERGRGRP